MGDERFVLVCNPPQSVYGDIVDSVSTTEDWCFQNNDYNIWKCYERHWLFVIMDQETGKFVASVSLARSKMRNGEDLYSVAFFYCKEEFRSMGFGKLLFDTIEDIYRDENVTLFGVGTMWEWYDKRYNFKQLQPYSHASSTIASENLVLNGISIPEPAGFSILKINNSDWERIHEYDATICEMKREKIVEAWLTASGVYPMIAVDNSGSVVGYGAIREVSLNRLMISPLYCDSQEIAVALLVSILKEIPEMENFKSIGAVYPFDNVLMDRTLATISNGKFSKSQFCRSQFTKKLFPVDQNKVFAIRHCAHGYV